MTSLVITIDIDWACESAIEETIGFFLDKNICPTVFSTHRSKTIENLMNKIDVGLHPFFGENSSHGNSISEVSKNVSDLPHNFKAFRCHRYGICNSSKNAMVAAGMLISSNVCTNLESVSPFQDRFGLLEVPIFLEDGGYLWQKHPLELSEQLKNRLTNSIPKVIVIHPMHFAINTPNFDYMCHIKQSLSRNEWNHLTTQRLSQLSWKGRGIRNFIIDLIAFVPTVRTMRALHHDVLTQHDHHLP